MATRKFRFVSPGVFLKEIDLSQLPGQAPGIGPVLIGRTRQGPAMKPYKVKDLEEFQRVFGVPMPGNEGLDPWRDGTHLLAESYVPYAARAHFLAGEDTPVTVVRLAGITGDNAIADSDAEPGWIVDNAYGLFVMSYDSGSSIAPTASLAAVFYAAESAEKFSINLVGTPIKPNGPPSRSDDRIVMGHGSASYFNNSDRLTIQLSSSAGLTRQVHTLLSEIRQDFNTNPVMTNNRIMSPPASSMASKYWLGESFESVQRKLDASVTSATAYKAAMILPLKDGMDDFRGAKHELISARTGWVIAQDTDSNVKDFDALKSEKLFRFIALHEGTEASRNIMVSIEDIRIPREGAFDPYGTFSVVVKRIIYGTGRLEELERFDNCSLDPSSDNFISRQIGDQYLEWSSTEKRNRVRESNLNISEYIRVELDSSVRDSGPSSPGLVPFGFLGPVRPKTTKVAMSGSTGNNTIGDSWVTGAITINTGSFGGQNMKIQWPDFPLVNSASAEDDFFMGATPFLQQYKTGSAYGQREQTSEMNPGYVDLVRRLGTLTNLTRDQDDGTADGTYSQHSFAFSLDDVVLKLVEDSELNSVLSITRPTDISEAYYEPGSKNKSTPTSSVSSAESAGASFAALAARVASGSHQLRPLLDVVKGFHMPLVGGSDGLNIIEANAFNNNVTKNASTRTSYAYASINRAIDLISDPEVVEHNLAAMPGITNESLTGKLVKTCESRADTLAIIDLPDVYVPPSENSCTDFRDRTDGTDPERSANNLVRRQINSSYGTTYYPWVKIRDNLNSRDVWVPPSVVALGAMAYTERTAEVWFAPAGFNRGGLNQGTAGVPVLQVSEHLMSKDRDTLYEANINPIASFVSEGIVIFGQKTLQSTKSALDRINVRRLMIFIKKEVSRICNTLLFEQNVQATWSRFTSRVVPFLESVKVRFGLSDFKVVLDDTTTTPDLVDRNIMYAKIFLKPARAIEFIAVDFIITNTGAEFDD